MQLLEYLNNSSLQIKFYYFIISKFDKKFFIKVFITFGNKNLVSIILVAINIYHMGIDNPAIIFGI